MKRKLVIFYIIFLKIALGSYPQFDINVNNNPYSGELFIHSMSQPNGYMAILDHNLDQYWSINSGGFGIDFKPNGNKLTYFNKDELFWVIADEYMEEIDTLQCTRGLTDYHDIRVIENGGYILQAYDSLYVDMSEIVDDGHPNALVNGILIIQEFDQNNNLIFEWDAYNHLDIAQYTNLNLASPIFTWMHGNSVKIDNDNNLILSNRRSSEILKINRITGEVIWILGGPLNEFEIIDDPLNGFRKQHDATILENGNLLLFDNGNQHSPPTTRIVEYQINEENKTATLIWEFINPNELVALNMGSVQRLPNQNTLISWGNTPGHGARIMEVNLDYIIVLDIEYPLGYNAYKARKQTWQFTVPMLVGDANLDESVNILDVLYLVNYVFNDNSIKNIFNLYKIDINKDYEMDVLDIVEMVNIILY